MAQATYWVGQDNNIYYGSGQEGAPVQNMGAVGQNWDITNAGLVDKWASTPQETPMVLGATRIDDPAIRQQAPAPVVGGGTGKVFNQAAVNATNQSLDSLGTILANALSSAQTGYDNASNLMKQQEARQRADYDQSTLGNMQNYDSNLAAALRAGRSGLSGLMSALRGGGGTGNSYARDWVQDTVSDTASTDIREGYNTFDENRRGLDSSLSTFLSDLQGRRRENEDALSNNRRAAELYDAQQRQSLLQTLSELYADGGRTGEASNYLAQAGSQAPRIAQNMGAQVSRYNAAPVNVQSPDMTAFSAPENRAMTATPNQNTGVFSLTDPRRNREEEELVGA